MAHRYGCLPTDILDAPVENMRIWAILELGLPEEEKEGNPREEIDYG